MQFISERLIDVIWHGMPPSVTLTRSGTRLKPEPVICKCVPPARLPWFGVMPVAVAARKKMGEGERLLTGWVALRWGPGARGVEVTDAKPFPSTKTSTW